MRLHGEVTKLARKCNRADCGQASNAPGHRDHEFGDSSLPPAETLYDSSSPTRANWTKTYPGSNYGQLDSLPLQVGDDWEEGGRTVSASSLAACDRDRPRLWVFTSVGRLRSRPAGQRRKWTAGITVEYRFTQPGAGVTLFTRMMTVEAPMDSPDARRFLPNRQPCQHRPLPRRDRPGVAISERSAQPGRLDPMKYLDVEGSAGSAGSGLAPGSSAARSGLWRPVRRGRRARHRATGTGAGSHAVRHRRGLRVRQERAILARL